MHRTTHPSPIAAGYNENTSTLPSIMPLTTLSIAPSHLIPRSASAYGDEDCTTSTTSLPAATATTSPIVAGISPGCTVTKLSDAVIALGVLCGFSIVGFVVLLICFIRQSNSSSNNSSRGRDRDRTPPCSHPNSPFPSSFHDRSRHIHDDEHPRRYRTYDGLGINGSRNVRLHRRHSMHNSPLVRSPLAPPRYMERAPENIPQVQNAGLFPRSPGRNRMFARSPLAMAGYPFMRNANMNPMGFAQGQAGLGLGGQEQMPHPGHIPPAQAQMYPQQRYAEQPGMMQPEHVHYNHAPVGIPEMRGAQEQAQRGSVRQEQGNIGRSRDPSNAGTAVRDDIFSRMRREVVGSRRHSRSETEGSRGRRGGGFEGGPPGPAAL